MTDSHCKRIGCICRRDAPQFEQSLNHMLDLTFRRTPTTDHGLFDTTRGIFIHAKIVRHGRGNGSPPGLSQFQSGHGIARYKYLFNRELIGSISVYEFVYALENVFES